MEIAIITSLIILSGLFSGLTLSLMSLNKYELKRKADLGDSNAAKVYPIRSKGNLLLCTLLVGNVLVNSVLSVFLGGMMKGAIAIGISTTLITIFGEILPQASFSKHALKVGARLSILVNVIMFILYPVCKPIACILDKLLGTEMNTIYSKKELKAIIEATGSKANDVIFILADKSKVVYDGLGALRLKLGHDLELIDYNKFNFLWVVDFPMFEYSEEEDRYKAQHHPFTSIKEEDLEAFFGGEMEAVRTNSYDLVLNGSEIGGGSIRIHNPEIQAKVFEKLGLSQEEARTKFGFFIDAFKYGAPPHGGLAFGIDRWLMVMLKESSIRDVIPFPKTNKGQCLMTEAPGIIEDDQLEELFIKSTFVKEEEK